MAQNGLRLWKISRFVENQKDAKKMAFQFFAEYSSWRKLIILNLILINCIWICCFSYDAHVLDPLAGLQFTTGTYYMLASNIKQLANELCRGRCVFFLEGGYNLQSLSNSVADSFRAFLGEPSLAPQFDDPAFLYEEPLSKVKQAILRAKSIHSL